MSTYVNPRSQPVRLVLSDGSERTVRAWGLAFLPDSLHVERAEYEDLPARRPVAATGARSKPQSKAA
jgi:hypothetical protein